MSETWFYYFKFMLMFFGILAILYILLVATPGMAKKIDEYLAKRRNGKPQNNDDLYKVKGIYDLPHSDQKNEDNKSDEEQK